LRDLFCFQRLFDAEYLIFAWDLGRSKRVEILPEYKANRHKGQTTEERETQKIFRKEMRELRLHMLPEMGYTNILASPGIEADDWIAQSCRSIAYIWPKDEMIIISADHDLLQCLSEHVKQYNPNRKKLHTLQSFFTEKRIVPREWSRVKALAGCSSDNIPGIKGVGEKTAIQYILDSLKRGGVKWNSIQNNVQTYFRNLPLVTLPMKGTPDVHPNKSKVEARRWRAVVKKLGMTTLKKRGPYVDLGISRRTHSKWELR